MNILSFSGKISRPCWNEICSFSNALTKSEQRSDVVALLSQRHPIDAKDILTQYSFSLFGDYEGNIRNSYFVESEGLSFYLYPVSELNCGRDSLLWIEAVGVRKIVLSGHWSGTGFSPQDCYNFVAYWLGGCQKSSSSTT